MRHERTRNIPYREGDPIPGTSYRFVRELAAGGHGSVYLVQHDFLEAAGVMKLLHDDLVSRADLAVRMTREARMLARLRHPNLVDVRDGGISAERPARPYFVMEPLAGTTLREMLRRSERGIDLVTLLRIGVGMLDGLAYAHGRGVIHRDIKPDNVFLHRVGAVSVTKLIDFGIAHLFAGKRLTGQRFLGTPRYAAPEQLIGEGPVPQTDLYAFGLVLYEAISGRLPYAHRFGSAAVIEAQLHEVLPPLSRVASERCVPPELERIVTSLVSKQIAERPERAADVAGALRNIIAQLDADASRPSRRATFVRGRSFETTPLPIAEVLDDVTVAEPDASTPLVPVASNVTLPSEGFIRTSRLPVRITPPRPSSPASASRPSYPSMPISLSAPVSLAPAPPGAELSLSRAHAPTTRVRRPPRASVVFLATFVTILVTAAPFVVWVARMARARDAQITPAQRALPRRFVSLPAP